MGRIIANHHSAKNIDTLEFRILWDSDWLVNIPEEFPSLSQEKMAKLINKVFKTDTGRKLALAQEPRERPFRMPGPGFIRP